jgi:hypothetical protein
MRRIAFLAVTSLLLILALGSIALAKESAVTKFDQLPGDWHAGQSYSLGYTILMDGQQPYKADTTEIVIRTASGKALSFPGVAEGAAGHYVAKVYFPAAGTYTWQVTQGSFFPPMDLGTVTVLAPATGASDAQPAPTPSPATDPTGLAVSIAAALVALGGAVRLAQLIRAQRRTTATT